MPHPPTLTTRREAGRDLPVLVWRLSAPTLTISSAPLGGGLGRRGWIVNATVPMSYDRDDPAAHLTAMSAGLGLAGSGIGHLTGVDVALRAGGHDGGVDVWATVGLADPIRAAAPDGPAPRTGTINIVAFLPVRMSEAALVNAVITVTEAKVQALTGRGLDATGTATDAVTIVCPADGAPEAYGGPRSRWGAPLARAAYLAVSG